MRVREIYRSMYLSPPIQSPDITPSITANESEPKRKKEMFKINNILNSVTKLFRVVTTSVVVVVRCWCIASCVQEMAKLLTAVFLLISLLIIVPYWVSRSSYSSSSSHSSMLFPNLGMVEATNGHGSPLEGRDRHHHERGGHIRRK